MRVLETIPEQKRLPTQDYEAVQIKIASAEDILSWSHGEVKSSETINYRTFKPERGGLFCARIFGPTHDYECLCGKYRRMKHRGITCEKCGVEVILSNARRERMGHVRLAAPVSHVWFLKGVPSRIGNLLDITLKELERVLYFDAYVVLEPGSSPLIKGERVEEGQAAQLEEDYPDLELGIGAEAIKRLLNEIDLETLRGELHVEMREATSEVKRKKTVKRLKIIESFYLSKNNPADMILDVLPVLSPELRPLVMLDGGRFATSDLNDLYRRVIHRNNRLKRLLDLSAPDLILRNEKRMLQESVDALFDNGRRGRPIVGSNKRALKSLSDMLKGKQGRFRQNLLGKRVDYSGRTVIVVGPELKLNQCGLPKVMALELFKPFIFHKLMAYYEVPTIKAAKKMLEERSPEVWEVLDEVCLDHPVMLNRAPTLHRLGIQAFEPVLIEGKAIQLHPLVCTAFNADFDGDQMAVHVPLSVEAVLEAKVLMMSTNNILSPANGKPIVTPTQDMVLGLYWMTRANPHAKGSGKRFLSPGEVRQAYHHEKVELQAAIKVWIEGEMRETTVGRILLREHLPEAVPFAKVNRLLKKRELSELVDVCYRVAGNTETVRMLDDIKSLGFTHATKAGFSICMDDMVIPAKKQAMLQGAQDEVLKVRGQYTDGLITEGERYNKVIDIWARLTDQVADAMLDNLQDREGLGEGHLNSIFAMADSGARGSAQQMKQLAGMRGLMAKPSGEIMETPITANFREGLSVLQYFISTHGARKGLADTALKTANSGYLTRRLVDVAQDMIITETDCGSLDGIEMSALVEAGEIIETLGDRVLGRVALHDVVNPYTQGLIVGAAEEIDEDKVRQLEEVGIEKVHIRSVLSCEVARGVCALCYGRDLARGRIVSLGEAVGVIAAQSIGEPGTQLTMRTFHVGGAANQRVEVSKWESKFSGTISYGTARTIADQEGRQVIMNRKTELRILDSGGREIESRLLPVGAQLLVADGAEVKQGQTIAEWDPFAVPIISDVEGRVSYTDIVEGATLLNQIDRESGLSRRVIIDSTETEYRPSILILDADGNPLTHPGTETPARFFLPAKAELMADEGDAVRVGDVLARMPRETLKNRDITGGLPRVVELLEARIPKDPSIISEIDGYITFGKESKRKRLLYITPEHGEQREYQIPLGKHIVVHEGEYVRAGELIVDGPANPHDILSVLGIKALQKYLVDEVQEVYRLQGVGINDKHIEVIVKQMLKQVRVVDPGDTTMLINENFSKATFERENLKMEELGLASASAVPVLQGITKAALSTDSFISAASFQDTTKVLTNAAIEGKIDHFQGLKENVILGKLIPSGTGFSGFSRRYYQPSSDVPALDEAVPAGLLEETG